MKLYSLTLHNENNNNNNQEYYIYFYGGIFKQNYKKSMW